MKTTINRFKCVAFLHPWERRTIARKFHRRATIRFRAGVALFLASAVPFLANAALWVIEAALVALLVAVWLIGRAWFMASTARKYDV